MSDRRSAATHKEFLLVRREGDRPDDFDHSPKRLPKPRPKTRGKKGQP